jgi:inner membrane protein
VATPIGHSLFGLACARLAGRRSTAPAWRWYLFAIVAANAPDLDLIPGLLAGDINKFHHGVTHSLTAALAFGVLAALAARWFHVKPLCLAMFGIAMYASHLLMDFFCSDGRPPFGLPLLWPFLEGHWISPYTVFSGVKHGDPGDSFEVFLGDLLSRENWIALGKELLLLPVLLFCWHFTRTGWQLQPMVRAGDTKIAGNSTTSPD